MVEMLPEIEVVQDDAFNSDPADPQNMGPEAAQRHRAGEALPTTRIPTPLVSRLSDVLFLEPLMVCTYGIESIWGSAGRRVRRCHAHGHAADEAALDISESEHCSAT